MPLLLIPLLVLGVLALWLLLFPVAMLQRYRYGKARRRAQPWAVRVNGVLLACSAPLFLLGAWIGTRWAPHGLTYAAIGLGAGVVLGLLGDRLAVFEATPRGLYYTPNRWLVLGLTLLVAGRVALGLWQLWRQWRYAEPPAGKLQDHASLLGVGGLLLGYYLGFARMLERRLKRSSSRRSG